MENSVTDKFGRFLIDNLRDKAIDHFSELEAGSLVVPRTQPLIEFLQLSSERDIHMFKQILMRVLDSSLHDFLRALQESHDFGEGISACVDGRDISDAGMLHGELFGEDGWIKKYSKYSEYYCFD